MKPCRLSLLILLVGLTSLSGCANWSNLGYQEPKSSNDSMLNRPIDDEIAQVEIIFFRLSPEQSLALEELWPRVNESTFSIALRRQLDKNGIRVATVDAVVPLALQQMIDSVEKRLKDDRLEQIGMGAEIRSHSRLLQCRRDQRKDVLVGGKRSTPLTLLTNVGSDSIQETFEEPQLLFDLRAHPDGRGATWLKIAPEIQHGDVKQRYVSQEFSLRRELKRDTRQWDDLAIERVLRPGQIVLLSASNPPRGLGAEFFYTDTATATREQLLVLLRVGPSKLNAAFAAK